MFRLFSCAARHQPYMVRRNYLYELRSALTFPLAISLTEGAFTGVIAAKSFDASVTLIAVITAAPMFGNILALFWADLARGRRKVPMVNWLQGGLILIVASVAANALLPVGAAGWLFAAQVILCRVLAGGMVTVRSAIWRANYPAHVRGQVVSKISVTAMAVLGATTLTGSWLLDLDARAYVVIYPAAALLGAIGIYQFSHVRVRRERLLRNLEQTSHGPSPRVAARDQNRVLDDVSRQPRRSAWYRFFGQAFELLRYDKQFRQYQWWQLLSGASFMMMVPSLLHMISTEMTDPREQYLVATFVAHTIPMVMGLICTQLWAPLFDRVHISVFRVFQGIVSFAAMIVLFTGASWGNGAVALTIVALGQVLVGVSHAGGNLAWNLGHNDFAPPDKSATYMGVHVMLTGLRGCFAPFLGAWLYRVDGIGRGIFLIAAVVNLVSLIGFATMARQSPKKAELIGAPARAA